jgi:hypothetical protein
MVRNINWRMEENLDLLVLFSTHFLGFKGGNSGGKVTYCLWTLFLKRLVVEIYLSFFLLLWHFYFFLR